MQLDITRTHDALIKAGGELFAAHGFDAVSVRQISTQAHANVAAVNYHFGGKQGLYNEIIRFMVSRRRQIKIKDILEAHPEWSKGPEGYARALHEYVRAQLFLVFDKNEPQWLSRLWLREISQPTEAMDILLAEFFRPSRQDLQDFLSMACPTLTQAERDFWHLFVPSQMMIYMLAKVPVCRGLELDDYPDDFVVKITFLIARTLIQGVALPFPQDLTLNLHAERAR